MNKKHLVIILGPTGIGKTDLSTGIALELGTEIISCDSRQFYKEMNIGTAVPSQEQLNKVKHHFIHHIPISTSYSASRFEQDFISLSEELFRKYDVLLMTGGSGLYIDAACGKMDDIPDVDPDVRKKYLRKYREEGLESIRSDLRLLDPDHYRVADLKNHKRILRALEICESTGQPYSSYLRKKGKTRNFGIIKIGLRMNRDELYERINARVDKMVAQGLEKEAKDLISYRHINALNTVGYKEFFSYMDGEITREKAIELVKRNSRRYAKRQMTWWARDNEIEWFNPEEKENIIDYITLKTTST